MSTEPPRVHWTFPFALGLAMGGIVVATSFVWFALDRFIRSNP